jgi:hypothetical protein
MAEASTRSRAGGRSAPAKKAAAARHTPGETIGSAGSQARTADEIEAERKGVQPKQLSGPGSGSKLFHAPSPADGDKPGEQKEVDLDNIAADDPSSIQVVLGDDVYEKVLAPGSSTRYVEKLLWRKGRSISKSILDRHRAAQRELAKSDDDDEEKNHDDPTGGTGNTGEGAGEPPAAGDK